MDVGLTIHKLVASLDLGESRREGSKAFGAPVEVAAVHDEYDT